MTDYDVKNRDHWYIVQAFGFCDCCKGHNRFITRFKGLCHECAVQKGYPSNKDWKLMDMDEQKDIGLMEKLIKTPKFLLL